MPISMYNGYTLSPTPSYESIKLPEAFRRVASGRLSAKLVYGQLPQEVQTIINEACRESMGGEFKDLTSDRQRGIFAALVIALDNTAGSATSGPIARPHPKKWWQIWR